MIVETFQLTATNTDVLAAPSRLSAIPYNGQLIIELQSSVNDATNYWQVGLQLPDGTQPMEDFRPPKGVTSGGVNEQDKYLISVPASAGGHILLTATENGTGVLDIRCTLMP